MIKRDISYIFKKIIIGIGIILGISFIRSCNVYALEDTTNMISLNTYNLFGDYSAFYDTSSGRIYGKKIKNNITYEQYVDLPENFNYLFYINSNTRDIYLFDTELFKLNSGSSYQLQCVSFPCNRYIYSFDTSTNNKVFTISNNRLINSGSNTTFSSSSNVFTNFDIYNQDKTQKIYTKNLDINLGVQDPEIVSLNPVLNKTDDNMLVSVSFSPEFSYIDTDNYNYYAWFEGEKKFFLTQNNVNLNTQINTTFYVEITDKQGNSIDTETFTVSSIGLVYNGDYDIQFIINEYTDSDTNNNSDLLIDYINRIDIDITYIPKWINYKYQYQFVPENGSLSENWILVNNNNANNNIVYTTNVNGTMYTRILDQDNNVLKSATFTITKIGELKTYDNNSNKIFSIFNKINNDINFGGPVSNLIIIPVNVIETILQAGSNMCTPYYLGTINGHPLSLTCIDPEDYLGSALWSTIDIIVSGCMIYSIFKWLTSLYWNFVILSDIPDIDSNSFGDRRDLK